MLNRINELIKSRKISASQFADEIGVQRSNISHVLSGRNKPSLDFVTKILMTYPEVNADWLLTGQGRMEVLDGTSVEDRGTDNIQDLFPEQAGEDENISRARVAEKKKTGRKGTSAGSKIIERIVILYKDGTFSEFIPGN